MALKTQVGTLLHNAEKLCRDCPGAEPLTGCIQEMRGRLAAPLRVAVVGIMKAGKSTFMNALMGANILCTGSLETTYTVAWFQYADTPSLTLCFRSGERQEAPFEDLPKWSVRDYEPRNPRINDVKYLIIHYPSEVLRSLEFIDTPGLNSVYGADAQNTLDFLAITGSRETLDEASMADAVIYAFSRSAGSFDRGILDAFHAGGSANASPINSVGILTKVDSSGIWDIYGDQTPVEAAQTVASTVMRDPGIHSLLFAVLPVCAKVAEGCTRLRAKDWEMLRRLADQEEEDLQDLLSNAAAFAAGDSPELDAVGPAQDRAEALALLGQYGALEVARLLRAGEEPTQISALLQQRCGVQAVRELLLSHFNNRAYLIKAQYVFNHLRALTRKLRKSGESGPQLRGVCGQIEEEIDSLISAEQTFKELKILQMYYNGEVVFLSEEERQDFLRVTGEYGRSPEAKLGMTGGATVADLERAARKKAEDWHARASGWMLPGAYVEAASTIARSYERLYYHLNALSEE